MIVSKTEKLTQESLLTCSEAGLLLQVTPSSINKWVRQGHIPSFRTPGGHNRIRAADLVTFLKTHQMPVPRDLWNADLRRLLVVDDEEPQLRAVERLLRPCSHLLDIRLTSNGIDALVLVGSFRPHVLLLDVFMPGIDGIEVCRRLRTIGDTEDVKVVVTSAHLTSELEQQALAAGAACCLPKPIDVGALLGLLEVPQALIHAAVSVG
jgi:excisionase family DNA binding protein